MRCPGGCSDCHTAPSANHEHTNTCTAESAVLWKVTGLSSCPSSVYNRRQGLLQPSDILHTNASEDGSGVDAGCQTFSSLLSNSPVSRTRWMEEGEKSREAKREFLPQGAINKGMGKKKMNREKGKGQGLRQTEREREVGQDGFINAIFL